MRRIVLAALLAATLVACSDGDDGDHGGGGASEVDAPSIEDLSSGLQAQVAWLLAYVNGDPSADADVESRLAESFLAAVPIAELEGLADAQLRPAVPYSVSAIERADDTSASILLTSATQTVRMEVRIEPESPHRITELLFRPAAPPDAEPLASWADLDRRLADAASSTALLAAEVVDGECAPIHATAADRAMPVASAFKLYVLGALAEEVEAGRASWDEQLTIRDDHRVHSSADHGTAPAGAPVALGALAASMIAVSDNTATDHVIARIGREAIEAVLEPMGMADPSRNRPFLTTAEVTRLKYLADDELRERWIQADEAGRRDLLATLPAGPVTDAAMGAVASPEPVAVQEIEWFASAEDLCRAHVALAAMGAEVERVLGANRGVDIDTDRWPSVAFKGGSEPGVLALSWLATRDDGRRFVLVALLADAEQAIPAALPVDVAAAFDLLSEA
ncbi:MAG TPA: serine hydrolase [Acidimicrobiales bacterium]|nr:serine hydrolase [Acidimicrobiales bacterium]